MRYYRVQKFNTIKNDFIRLRHILESAYYIKRFAAGRSRSDLDNDRMLLNSIIRELEIIGEAAKITKETKQRMPEIPWNAIIGTRNRLIHAYNNINLDIVWNTVEINIPELIKELEKIPEIRELKYQ